MLKTSPQRLEYLRKYRSRPEVKVLLRKRYAKYRQRFKKIVYDHYGNKCECCGETEELFLTIEHLNNDGREYRRKNPLNRWTASFYKWIIENKFPDDLTIRCYNCNCGRDRDKDKICPHKKQPINNDWEWEL